MGKREKYKTNALYHYAEDHRKNVTDERDIEKNDMTDVFWDELDSTQENDELININLNAPPTSGKTTCAMAIADRQMQKHYGRKLRLSDIDRDQQEFSKTMRNPEIKNTIRVIDEWNELESTGENSSVERALYNYFSDVMAQRFVHKISCSPNDCPDKNALIYLEVFSTDKVKKVNHCKLFYKLPSAEGNYKQLLGTVSIDVSRILKQKWYQEYRRRKFQKMELILNEGIFKPRVLDYAEIILGVVEELRPLTRLTNLINPDIIKTSLKAAFRESKIPQSIVGEELATREAKSTLDLWKAHWKVCKEISVTEKKQVDAVEKGKEETVKLLDRKLQEMIKIRDKISKTIGNQENELKRYAEINKEYNKPVD